MKIKKKFYFYDRQTGSFLTQSVDLFLEFSTIIRFFFYFSYKILL